MLSGEFTAESVYLKNTVLGLCSELYFVILSEI